MAPIYWTDPSFWRLCFSQPEYKAADPICTFLFSALVLGTTFPVTKDVFRVLMEGKKALPACSLGLSRVTGTKCSLQELRGTFVSTAWESSCCLSEESQMFTVCTFGASTWRSRCCPSTWLQVGWRVQPHASKPEKTRVWSKVSNRPRFSVLFPQKKKLMRRSCSPT